MAKPPIVIPAKLIPKIEAFERRANRVAEMTRGMVDLNTDETIQTIIDLHNMNRVDRKDVLSAMVGNPQSFDPGELKPTNDPGKVDKAGSLVRGQWRGIPGSSKVIDVPLSGKVNGKTQIRHAKQRQEFVEKQIRDVWETKSKRQKKNLKRAMRTVLGIVKGKPIDIK